MHVYVNFVSTVERPIREPPGIGTTSLQRTLLRHNANYFTSEINLSTRDKTISPKVSLVQRFHCTLFLLSIFVQ